MFLCELKTLREKQYDTHIQHTLDLIYSRYMYSKYSEKDCETSQARVDSDLHNNTPETRLSVV